MNSRELKLFHPDPKDLGLSPDQYAAALRYLFDRPVPHDSQDEWYWNIDEPAFDATPLEWTRIQTVLFANAGRDLQPYTDEQVGMGLNYVMSNAVSDVPFAAIDTSVPNAEALQMLRAMHALWRDGIGPRLSKVRVPIGRSAGRLACVCYMWFDVWPTFRHRSNDKLWQDALWHVFTSMLAVPCREVQIAALHGIGHCGNDLNRQNDIDTAVDAFVRQLNGHDKELADYAYAARLGHVQ